MPETRRTRGQEKRDKFVAFRMTPSEYAAIDKRAKKRDMTMTEFVIRSSLGDLQDPSRVDKHLAEIDDRLDKLERAAQLGAYG